MRKRGLGAVSALVLMCGTGLVVIGVMPAGAATTVSTEAQLQTAWADTNDIVLANDISLTCNGGGDLDRNSGDALTLDGAGFTVTQTCANERVMESSGLGDVTLKDVTVTGGQAVGNGGGGIRSSATVNVENSTITGNSAPTTGGGGINADNAFITNSTISNNTASDFGGAINVTNATLIGSTVSGNDSGDRAGGISAGTATLTNSTVANNVAHGSVSGQHGQGGGIYPFTTTLVYSTVVDNNAEGSRNVYAETAINPTASVIVGGSGGGSDNCGGGATTTSGGQNASDDDSCGLGSADHEITNPDLGDLTDNGGPTSTRAPSALERALVDAIPAADCQSGNADGVDDDQRGIARPQNNACDIGAVELEVVDGSTTTTTVSPTTPTTVPVTPEAEPAEPVDAEPAFTG